MGNAFAETTWGGSDRLRAARKLRDWTQHQLAEAIGVGQSAVAQWERGRNPPPPFAIKKMVEFFGCDESWLMYGTGTPPSGIAAKASAEHHRGEHRPRAVMRPDVDLSERMPLEARPVMKNLPLYAAVKGSYDGEFIDMSNPIGVVERPPYLDGVSEAFATVVTSDSMEPRYFSGETLFVNPRLPVRRGDFVVVELEDHQGIVKRLLKLDDREVILEQYNPPDKRAFKRSEVLAICRIMGSGPPQ